MGITVSSRKNKKKKDSPVIKHKLVKIIIIKNKSLYNKLSFFLKLVFKKPPTNKKTKGEIQIMNKTHKSIKKILEKKKLSLTEIREKGKNQNI